MLYSPASFRYSSEKLTPYSRASLTEDTCSNPIQHVGVDHGRSHDRMPQVLVNRPDLGTVSRKSVTNECPSVILI